MNSTKNKLDNNFVFTKRGLDWPLFLLYNGVTMKTITKKPVKMRNKIRKDEVYYVLPGETKEVDGVEFVYVIKNYGIRETPKLMRKDSLEYLK